MDLSRLILTALRRRRFPRMMLRLSINNGQQLQIGTPAVLASEFSVCSVSCAVCLLASDKGMLTWEMRAWRWFIMFRASVLRLGGARRHWFEQQEVRRRVADA